LAATARLYRRGADLLVENLARIAAGEPGAAQEGEGCYDSWPARRDVAALRSRAALVHAGDLWRNRPH
ncbi:MAG TPA: hypothetical protein VH301_14595, partial [Usitatibacter sp.]|nr:hypothetical protein [Usitatibacter sp.]